MSTLAVPAPAGVEGMKRSAETGPLSDTASTMTASKKTDLDQAVVTYVKMRTVFCGAPNEEGIHVDVDGETAASQGYKYCKTELLEVDFDETVFRGGGMNIENFTYNTEQAKTGIKEASILIKGNGPAENYYFALNGEGKWVAVWENPNGRDAFPVHVEIQLALQGNVKCDLAAKKRPVYVCTPWKTRIRDPEKQNACCVVS